MDELSEQEQWDSLKSWVRTNGPQVVILVAVMLLGWSGWKWWKSHNEEQAQAAGNAYQAILAKFDDSKPVEGVALIEALRTQYPKSPYVAAADMVAARVFVESNQLDKAAERLDKVAKTAVDEKLRPVAQIRLARVQSAQGKYDVALATLGTASMGEHEAARLETHGDILLAKGDRAGALKDYEAARKLQPAVTDDSAGDPNVSELLDLKVADLKGSTAASAAVAPATVPAPATPAPAATGKP
ncbi:MAG: tetratricopeptide repeat protein [Pseudomonadota bacterium]